MPEHFVVCTICKEIKKIADKVGARSYKSAEDPLEHGILVFHPQCCAQVDGNRQTVSFHTCPKDDPIFRQLPPAYSKPPPAKKDPKARARKNEDIQFCKSCGGPPASSTGSPVSDVDSLSLSCPSPSSDSKPAVVHARLKAAAEILNDLCITGPLYCISRGKELVFAISHYVFRVCFSLKGHSLWVPTLMYRRIVSGETVKRGAKSSAFSIPPDLSDGPPGVPLKISIQAAFVRPDWTLLFIDHNVMITFHVMALRMPCSREDLKPTSKLWPFLWSASHGPDFVLEPDLAHTTLEEWKARMVVKQDTTPIFLAIKDTQTVFNGFGAQETCDMLFLAMIHPVMPVYQVCSSDDVWGRLVHQLKTFHATRVEHVAGLPATSSTRPFRMNHNAHNRFLALVLCYRRKVVYADQPFLDRLHSANLLDSTAVIQHTGHAIKDPSLLPIPGLKPAPTKVRTSNVQLPNYLVIFPKGKNSSATSLMNVEQDVKNELNKTTLGPYSFQLFVQASWTMAKISKSATREIPNGRQPLITTEHGRLKRPLAADIRRTGRETKAKRPKTTNLLQGKENQDVLGSETHSTRSQTMNKGTGKGQGSR